MVCSGTSLIFSFSIHPFLSFRFVLISAAVLLLGVGALAIINDSDGSLVGNFSARDLKGLYLTNLPRFTQQVETYLRIHSPKSLSPLLLSPYSSFFDAVQRFRDDKVHQFWITNAQGSLSQSSCFSVLLSFFPFLSRNLPSYFLPFFAFSLFTL